MRGFCRGINDNNAMFNSRRAVIFPNGKNPPAVRVGVEIGITDLGIWLRNLVGFASVRGKGEDAVCTPVREDQSPIWSYCESSPSIFVDARPGTVSSRQDVSTPVFGVLHDA